MPLVRKFANSDRLALPSRIAPAARSLATTGESLSGTLFSSATEPAVVGMPAASRLSLTITGMPCSGPRTWPAARSASSAAASSSAFGLSVRTALIDGPSVLVSAIRCR